MAADCLPIVDASAKGGDPDRLARDIGRAARDTGFFYLVGHGIPRDLTRSVFGHAMALFDMDEPFKRMLSAERSRHGSGYVPFETGGLDAGEAAEMREAFTIGLELPEDHPEIAMGVPFRGPNQWPANRAFRQAMLAYFWACWSIGRRLHQAIARDLAMPADFFEDKFDRPLATLRLLHYPPYSPKRAQGAVAAGEHTDGNVLTLSRSDGTVGLEIRRTDGSWTWVPHVAGAFVVNVGDCLMRWTNDTYVSAAHRVVHHNTEDRYSLEFFLNPNPEADVAVLSTCVTAERPARYGPITGAAYLSGCLNCRASALDPLT